jgi:membrane protease YdiL (CAAX protease family)
VLLYAVAHYPPSALAATAERLGLPIYARVLYGGITEELLLRWGLMTTLVWLMWRFLQRRHGVPRAGYVWLAICISALLFGVGHLPIASMLADELSGSAVAYVVGTNAAFGLLFGFLFWRHGLESAMIAHATAHVVAYVGGQL